jgi:hypothetical protein
MTRTNTDRSFSGKLKISAGSVRVIRVRLWLISYLLKQVCFVENVFRTCAPEVVLSQIDPAHSAGLINQKLSRTRDIRTAFTRTRVQQIVTSNHFSFLIGKKRKSVTRLLHQVARLFRSVDTDRHRTNTRLIETRQTLFNTPQLGVAQRSPVTAVEDQQNTFRRFTVDRRG